jgi:Zn-dependent protease/predicted transcriptional regulator
MSMIGQGVRIGTVRGIPVKADWSLLVILWLLTWSLATGGLPALASGYSSGAYWFAAVLTSIAFFVSLLAHELSHSLVARRHGIQVRDITLWLLGGVSQLSKEPDNPSDDFRVAFAGPLASLVFGAGSFVVGAILDVAGASRLVVACFMWLATVNVILGVFNLIPAAPLDGGRVLRAILWRRTGDRTRASLDATKSGRVFGYVLVALGFVELLSSTWSGLWLVLLGWFLLGSARAEENQIKMGRDLGDVRVRDVMTAHPITVPADIDVETVLHEYVLRCHCSSFPVVDRAGRVVGLVTLNRLRSLAAHHRATSRVGDIAIPLAEVVQAAPDDMLLDVLRRGNGQETRILVFQSGALVGIVSASDVTRAFNAVELQKR